MELGVALPTSARYASVESIVRIAQEAERLGYSSLWTYERLLYPIAGITRPDGSIQQLPEPYKSVYKPIETLSYVAAHTQRVKLGTSIVNAPFQSPVLLARRFATLDRFSNGRAIAGLGQGWMPQEFATSNVALKELGKRIEEYIAALRAIWGPDPVSYEGSFYHIPASLINPKPVQQGGIPILMGFNTMAALKRAARLADILNPIASSFFLNIRVADIRASYEKWRRRGAEFLTEPKDHGVEIRCYMRDPDNYLIEVGQTTAPQA